MKSIRVSRPGGPEVLELSELPDPVPGPGELLVRHTAIAVNFVDTYFRSGLYPAPALPFTPGNEGAGVVEALGEGVTGFAPGDRVAYLGPPGSYAEKRSVPASRVVKLPARVSDLQACSLIRGLSAWALLTRSFPVQEGHTILWHAAAGGLGLIAGQWARHLGAILIGTVSSDSKLEIARAHGFDHVINYSAEDFVARTHALTEGRGVDVVYDGVGKDTFLDSLRCLKKHGMGVSFGNASGPVPPLELLKLPKGSLYLTRPTVFDFVETREELLAGASAYFGLLERGLIRLPDPEGFPLAEAKEAHERLQDRSRSGSVCLLP